MIHVNMKYNSNVGKDARKVRKTARIRNQLQSSTAPVPGYHIGK